MNTPYFFITTYDSISGLILASILNEHPDINCSLSNNDIFVAKTELILDKKSKIVDPFVLENSALQNKFNGNVQRFAAHELQHRILSERTIHPLKIANIVIDPILRIKLLQAHWLSQFESANAAVTTIEANLLQLQKSKHDLFDCYNFKYFDKFIFSTAIANHIDVTNANHKLFLYALAKVIAYDSADLPNSIKKFRLEDIINTESHAIDLFHYITKDQIDLDAQFLQKLSIKLTESGKAIAAIHDTKWEAWQINLLNLCLETRLFTIYYPHIDRALATFYVGLGYQLNIAQQQQPYSKLLSIQLNSNRPTQLMTYLDNIEDTIDDPQSIEVLVNIDDDDTNMETTLRREQQQRPFTIKFTRTPRPTSFCDLWAPINKLLEIADPHAYFLLNISDEMLFATHGWDTILKKYVGYFPDDLFRLRASRNQFRNYFDRWECSFAQDAIPITTKKWVDIGGDWNPCFGPDSFQQLISFYLAREGQFSSKNFLREMPLLEIKFHGDVPGLGIDRAKAWKHARNHLKAMQICQSYPMQLEAKRRAMLIKGHILAYQNQLQSFELKDDKAEKVIALIDKGNNIVVKRISYRVSKIGITLTNEWRKLNFSYYFGGGKEEKRNLVVGFARYLKANYILVEKLYELRHLIGREGLSKIKQTMIKIPMLDKLYIRLKESKK